MSINLKTAKTLGLTIPQSLLQRADDVIQYVMCLPNTVDPPELDLNQLPNEAGRGSVT